MTVRAAIRLLSLLPLAAALALGGMVGRMAYLLAGKTRRVALDHLGLVVGTIRRKGPGRGGGHLLEVVEIPFDPDAPDRELEAIRVTAACSCALEDAIRRSPEEWVWMHERWKTRPPVEVAAPQQASRMPKSAELSDA